MAAQIPALHLYPLNDSFVPKQISLAQGRVRIGRQTNARTVPGERNGYFDSKVLSRMHAEVWEENGKILIKDVKSSNGTFINSERLSPEGAESEPFELKSEDIVEFGIDIVGEDNRTIVHHKVAAKVYCILNPEDLLASQREMQYLRNPSNRLPHPQQVQGQTLGGMGSARAPGKSGLTFDHLLSRLQGEIVKSRETGNELNMIGREMGEIGDTLSGGLPQHPPPPPPHPHPPQREASSSNVMLNTLQSQLHETRASLASHADKVRTLESLLAEHDALKREVAGMREAMEESRRLVE
ncbi:SMAD/FHA domain-containing protein, partial [Calocera viscosa TUFC12733]